MKNCKRFYETQTASHLQESFSLSPNHPHQIKCYHVFGKEIFLRRYTEIHRHLLSKYFENAVLGRQEMVQCRCFLWHQAETCLLILFSISSEPRFVKWVMFFERNCIVKWAIFFASFCWLWDFLLQNLKSKRNYKDFHWYIWTNATKYNIFKKRNNIFNERIPSMTHWIIHILVQISFLGTALGCFSQCFFFKFFVVGQPWWPKFLLSPPP